MWNISDLHWGNSLVDYELFISHLELIKSNKNHFIIFGGDTLDAIILGDKRFSFQALDERFYKRGDDYQSILDRAIDSLCAELEPVKSKIIGFLEGNHEVSADKSAQTRVARRLAANLNTYHFGYSLGLGIKLRDGNCKFTRQYIGFIHHGSGGAQTKGGKLNRGISKSNDWEGVDFHMRGHLHDPQITPMVRGSFKWRSNYRDIEFIAKDYVIVQSGSYLKSRSYEKAGIPNAIGYREPFNAYSETREYSLVHLGMRGVKLSTREHSVVGVEPNHFKI